MNRRIKALFVLAGTLCIAAAGAAVVLARTNRAPSPSPARAVAIGCPSASVGGTLPALVYLPAGYNSGRRYPVIYFLHGLPAGTSAYTQNAFVAAAAARVGSALIVAPQGVRNTGDDDEYLDLAPNRDWPQAIAHDLPACVDHRFRTLAFRQGRALIGLSAGGFGAFNIGLRNLSRFSAVESWSGYFAATDPSGHKVLELGSPEKDTAARVPSGAGLKAATTRWPSLIAFYVGDQDDRFLDMNQAFDSALRRSGVQHLFRVYGGGHSGTLWRTEAPHWLSLALVRLTKAR